MLPGILYVVMYSAVQVCLALYGVFACLREARGLRFEEQACIVLGAKAYHAAKFRV